MRYTLTISMRVIQAANEKVPFKTFTISVMLASVCCQGTDVFGCCLKNRNFFCVKDINSCVTLTPVSPTAYSRPQGYKSRFSPWAAVAVGAAAPETAPAISFGVRAHH
jgi:hypothetical protein